MKNKKFHIFKLFFALIVVFVVSLLFCQTNFIHSVYSTLFANANSISYSKEENEILYSGLTKVYISSISVADKIYDGQTNVVIENVVAKNEGGDIVDVEFSLQANTIDANAGDNKYVNFSNIQLVDSLGLYTFAGFTSDYQSTYVNILPKPTRFYWETKDISLPNSPKTAETGIYTYTGINQKNGVTAYYDTINNERINLNVNIKEKDSSVFKNEFINAGEYEANIITTIGDKNYNLYDENGDQKLSLKMNKIISKLNFDKVSTFTYNGKKQDLGVLFTTNNNEIDELVFQNDSNYFTKLGEVPNNGRSVYVRVPETRNYTAYPADGNSFASYPVSKDRFLKKASVINVGGIPTEYVYNGSMQEIEKLAFLEDKIDNSEQIIRYSDTASFINCQKNRPVEIFVVDSENFKAFSTTIYINILKAKVDTSNWSWSKSTLEYNKQEQGVYIKNYNTSIVDRIEYTNATATDAGVYVASANVILKDPDNYEEVTIPNKIWTINKFSVSKDRINLEDRELFYTGEDQPIRIEGEGYGYFNVTNNSNKDAGKYQIHISLVDTNNYEWKEDKTVDDLVVNLTIKKAKVKTPMYFKKMNYTGNSTFVQIASSDLYTVFGSNQTEIGKYEAYLILNDEDNYEWEDNPNKSYLVINWEIANVNYSPSSSVLAILIFTFLIVAVTIWLTLHFTIKVRRRRRKKKANANVVLDTQATSISVEQNNALQQLSNSNDTNIKKIEETKTEQHNSVKNAEVSKEIKKESATKTEVNKEDESLSKTEVNVGKNKTNGKPRKKRMLSMKKNDKKERRKKENLKLSKLKKAPAKRGRPAKKKTKSKK